MTLKDYLSIVDFVQQEQRVFPTVLYKQTQRGF